MTSLDPDLTKQLTERFANRVMTRARLPAAQRPDVEGSLTLNLEGRTLFCTCDITGSTKTREWRGAAAAAEELVEDLADERAFLISDTPHYAWLRAGR